ncbi:hypothetical protein [Lentilitoribacter sp. Alg239-R112]|uniref:hypothetical protein n=1 Tax=Lentilitoribacter sp. Alg239-R112 TaxID=2305987 RepID=UPI0013A69937|nr:hypothetical protein [Lentilitoribacter sp. Alg239-R112]
MLANANRYEELSSVFSDHVLTLDVTVRAENTWNELAKCMQIFVRHDVKLLKLSYVAQGSLSFRLDCGHHSEISSLEEEFDLSGSPKKISWVVTIGRRKSNLH